MLSSYFRLQCLQDRRLFSKPLDEIARGITVLLSMREDKIIFFVFGHIKLI